MQSTRTYAAHARYAVHAAEPPGCRDATQIARPLARQIAQIVAQVVVVQSSGLADDRSSMWTGSIASTARCTPCRSARAGRTLSLRRATTCTRAVPLDDPWGTALCSPTAGRPRSRTTPRGERVTALVEASPSHVMPGTPTKQAMGLARSCRASQHSFEAVEDQIQVEVELVPEVISGCEDVLGGELGEVGVGLGGEVRKERTPGTGLGTGATGSAIGGCSPRFAKANS